MINDFKNLRIRYNFLLILISKIDYIFNNVSNKKRYDRNEDEICGIKQKLWGKIIRKQQFMSIVITVDCCNHHLYHEMCLKQHHMKSSTN